MEENENHTLTTFSEDYSGPPDSDSRRWLRNKQSADHLQGTQVGPFIILEKIGSGGFCSVFKAKHAFTGNCFALKISINPSQKELERLRNEAVTGLALRHQNIIITRMIDHAAITGTGIVYWIAQDLADGLTITKLMLLRAGNYDVQAREKLAVGIGIQVLQALQHMHEQGIVHCDVKPANIIINSNGDAKLIDFGLAHRIGHVAERPFGTRGFIAPELWDSHRGPRLVNPQYDIYSLGVTLWSILAKKQPSSEYDFGDLPILEEVDSTLRSIIARMTAVLPSSRFLIVSSVYTLLRKWLEARPQNEEVSATSEVL